MPSNVLPGFPALDFRNQGSGNPKPFSQTDMGCVARSDDEDLFFGQNGATSSRRVDRCSMLHSVRIVLPRGTHLKVLGINAPSVSTKVAGMLAVFWGLPTGQDQHCDVHPVSLATQDDIPVSTSIGAVGVEHTLVRRIIGKSLNGFSKPLERRPNMGSALEGVSMLAISPVMGMTQTGLVCRVFASLDRARDSLLGIVSSLVVVRAAQTFSQRFSDTVSNRASTYHQASFVECLEGV